MSAHTLNSTLLSPPHMTPHSDYGTSALLQYTPSMCFRDTQSVFNHTQSHTHTHTHTHAQTYSHKISYYHIAMSLVCIVHKQVILHSICYFLLQTLRAVAVAHTDLIRFSLFACFLLFCRVVSSAVFSTLDNVISASDDHTVKVSILCLSDLYLRDTCVSPQKFHSFIFAIIFLRFGTCVTCVHQ